MDPILGLLLFFLGCIMVGAVSIVLGTKILGKTEGAPQIPLYEELADVALGFTYLLDEEHGIIGKYIRHYPTSGTRLASHPVTFNVEWTERMSRDIHTIPGVPDDAIEHLQRFSPAQNVPVFIIHPYTTDARAFWGKPFSQKINALIEEAKMWKSRFEIVENMLQTSSSPQLMLDAVMRMRQMDKMLRSPEKPKEGVLISLKSQTEEKEVEKKS